ncbi:SDR family oxidoreductase [Pseudomarimonas arenosa]|uniref:NAD(P)H-binding protein n=1 Tax=Pseudomarimonas arenosa TaxID=2774145 RepID=A0AAW3ZH65_9GAMM|nr:NAD(P)H-binding protein [Pseudomarimonas arenosa]MBD8524604.1 NAD(P)H-binding protein [Pseudomarimonas arenosa]
MQLHTGNESNTGMKVLVIGGTGKTGRRVAERLINRGVETRVVSRSTSPAFDWHDEGTWGAALDGISAVYITFAPDLAVPGATDRIQAFVDTAAAAGVDRLVLLSGRGEEEAQACERIVQAQDLEWTVVRASWFMQNFSEGEFAGMVHEGMLTLPAADIPEPFIDVNDIADVAVAALTEPGHAHEIYEVTGPRLLTLEELAEELSRQTGHSVRFQAIPQADFDAALLDSGLPEDIRWLLNYLFSTVLDGRNAHLCDGVQRALGREPADFSDFVERQLQRGTWARNDAGVAA